MASHDNPKKQHQATRNSNFLHSVKNALHGIWMMLVRERNLRFHVGVGFVALVTGLCYDINRSDWLWLSIAIFIVVSSEFLNTIIESLVDLVVDKRYHPLAGLAKDVAAGGVLVAGTLEFIILAIIFQPYIWRQIGITTHFFPR